ncbi:MAG: ribonuclease H-like domain-containing protein [Bacteroidota bacterium]
MSNKNSNVVFDIETLSFEMDHFDDVQTEYLLKFAKTDEEREAELQKLALYPLTARIIAIGMLNPDSGIGKVFFQSDKTEEFKSDDGRTTFIATDEKGILVNFWETIQHYERFITFNGRAFDCPFIMIRSMILGVPATRNIMPYRYGSNKHCDLLEQLTFYGAMKKFNLDFYTKAFGIKSPKSDGITGLDLKELFEEKKFREIARYCYGDIVATSDLFKKVDQYLHLIE